MILSRPSHCSAVGPACSPARTVPQRPGTTARERLEDEGRPSRASAPRASRRPLGVRPRRVGPMRGALRAGIVHLCGWRAECPRRFITAASVVRRHDPQLPRPHVGVHADMRGGLGQQRRRTARAPGATRAGETVGATSRALLRPRDLVSPSGAPLDALRWIRGLALGPHPTKKREGTGLLVDTRRLSGPAGSLSGAPFSRALRELPGHTRVERLRRRRRPWAADAAAERRRAVFAPSQGPTVHHAAPTASPVCAPSDLHDTLTRLDRDRRAARRDLLRALERTPIDPGLAFEMVGRIVASCGINGAVRLELSARVVRIARQELERALEAPSPRWGEVRRWHRFWCAARTHHDALAALRARGQGVCGGLDAARCFTPFERITTDA